ncbi:hypothetical protein [Companilactobacillus alimentarius]|uniref:hypothetical protein n=1 Tax=Companilactobacillus alimentarius TaxID=1602 RepID=UPI0028BCCDAE|nr:hypothetical protein [Companilactobacillus alimentarius]MDT6953588.1 hypothetical protein [Companilactobacillus alimentarius]MDT6953656.1 hypothetical protein [Companilactobacillus alimentarius]
MKKYKLKLDYTEEELKELRILGRAYDGPIAAVYRLGELGSSDDPFRNLQRKYRMLDIYKEFDFMADINNVVMGTAIFPEELYIVHDTNTDSVIYPGYVSGRLMWGELAYHCPVKRTKDQWLAINPAYEPMLERVEN